MQYYSGKIKHYTNVIELYSEIYFMQERERERERERELT